MANQKQFPGGVIAMLVCAFAGAAVLAQLAPDSVEVAFVANAEGAEVALVDVAARSLIGTIAVNFADVEAAGSTVCRSATDASTSPWRACRSRWSMTSKRGTRIG